MKGMNVLLLLVGAIFLVGTVSAQLVPATLAVTRLLEWYNVRTGQFNGVGWWHTGNCLTSVAQYAQRADNATFNAIFENMLVKNTNFTTEGYDDEGWWGMAWIEVYKFTNNPNYLNLSVQIFANMVEAWDDTCGGGIWWNREKTYKNAITNELFFALATELFIATKDPQYQKWALQEWAWFSKSGMINNQSLINDGLTSNCQNNGATEWTYNQGVVLVGLVNLFHITGDRGYLGPATQIAEATIQILSSNGILQERCEPNNCDGDQVQFKGVFMRGLYPLYRATHSGAFQTFITHNAASIWANDRSGFSLGLKWGGPFDSADAARQSSALDALNAAFI